MHTHQSWTRTLPMTSSRHNAPRPCACTTVRTTSRLLARAYDSALQETELNVTQLAVLRAIERTPREPLSHVAEQLSMDRTSMYRSVAKMRDRGWLRLSDGPDARSRCAVLAERGRRVLDDAAHYWETVQTEIVDRFGRRRWSELVEELRALSAVVDEVQSDESTRRDEEESP